MAKLGAFEESLLQDADVRFGFDNYELLKQVGEFFKEVRTDAGLSQTALEAASGVGQAEISRMEGSAMKRGPT